LVPVPAPVLVPDPENLAQFSNNKKILQNLAFSMSAAALFSRKLASHFDFLTFSLHFIFDQNPNSTVFWNRNHNAFWFWFRTR
jgi:hypothetical protein